MNTADPFDRYVETLMGELAGRGIPAYLDDALATATARPQRRPSILGRLSGRSSTSRPSMLRTAMFGLPVVLTLAIGLVGVLMIGGADESPSPSAVPSLGTAAPESPTPRQTAATGETCPGYLDAADALQWDERGGVFAGPPLPAYPEGAIAAFEPDLAGGRPAIVLVDAATGSACRLVGLEGQEETRELEWILDGQALAFLTGDRLLVWASGGILEVHRAVLPGVITFDWSSTAQAFAIGNSDQGRLVLAFADGSKVEVGIEAAQGLAWSPDGRRLYTVYPDPAGDGVLHALISVGGDIIPIDLGDAINGGNLVAGWLDNDTLIIGGSRATDGYDAYDVNTGTREPWSEASTETFGRVQTIGYAPGLTRVALFANAATDARATPLDLIVQDLPSGEIRVLGTRLFTFGAFGSGAWSPDGTRIAVALEGAEDDPQLVPGLWLYTLAGAEPTHLISDFQVRLGNTAWGPLP